jgi:hypothetical protein
MQSVEQIPAISIRQPWAELILTGKKTVEVRSWATDFRGGLWVHAGLKANPELEEDFGLGDLYKGGYLGTIVLEAVVPFDSQRWELWRDKHLCVGEYFPGLYAWILSTPHRLSCPVQGPGKLNLFYPPPQLGEALHVAQTEISAPSNCSPAQHSDRNAGFRLRRSLPFTLWSSQR